MQDDAAANKKKGHKANLDEPWNRDGVLLLQCQYMGPAGTPETTGYQMKKNGEKEGRKLLTSYLVRDPNKALWPRAQVLVTCVCSSQACFRSIYSGLWGP